MASTNAAIASWTLGYCIVLAVVGLKLYTRIKYVNGLEIDDYIAMFTLAILTAGMGVVYTMLVLGLQEDESRWLLLSRESLELMFKCYFISVQLYTFGILFLWICVIFTLLGSVLNFFWCKPLYAFWTAMPFPMMEKYCDTNLVEVSVYMYSGYNILTDLCIMVVPYFLLSRVNIQSRGKRIALFGLFGIGTFVIISTIIKIVAIAQPENFHPPELVLWSFVEACVAIVVVCLPSLPPLIWKNSRFTDVPEGGISAPRWDDVEGPNIRLDETVPGRRLDFSTNEIPSSRLSTADSTLWDPLATNKGRNNSSSSSISNAKSSKLTLLDSSTTY
ncbi:hypothetical protein TWF481_003658 [Arthrobotrys musiformis]|uniref:Rhodopsin domain-containing protein n=1 Tax=Arthrobotrys musiformis TaxID=47236 RepID=A0AAV9WI49_9PEZI